MAPSLKVLIVDDSALMRNLLTRAFEETADIRVVGRAMNGVFALKKLAFGGVDVVTLDLEMPQMNGIEFLQERQRRGIDVPVVILSSVAHRGARVTMEALSLGAVDFVLKPEDGAALKAAVSTLVELVRIYGNRYRRQKTGGADSSTVRAASPARPSRPLSRRREPGPVELVAIAVSTGGPAVLRSTLSRLDGGLRAPVVIVQHMPPGFTGEFAASLDRVCALEVREARDGDVLKPGRILLAPGDRHLRVDAQRLANTVRLGDDAPVSGHRPSADVLFETAAEVYRNRCLGVIMTGMGRDGAGGLARLYEEGGRTLAQEEGSCVVFGMPRAAIELGAVEESLSPLAIADRINSLAGSGPVRQPAGPDRSIARF